MVNMNTQGGTKFSNVVAVSVVALTLGLVGGAAGAHAQSTSDTASATPTNQVRQESSDATGPKTRQIVVEEKTDSVVFETVVSASPWPIPRASGDWNARW